MQITPDNGIDSQKLEEKFQFHRLHPMILLGTASDRYEGWTGQIYNREQYKKDITSRSKTVGGKSFVEKILPVESIEEYFVHFPVLEIDYTFYSTLLDNDGKPTRTFHVLSSYRKHMKENDHVILKVPQIISAQKVHHGGKYIKNESYLNAEIFKNRFYEPATEILGFSLKGMIFEQEYQRKQDRTPVSQMADSLDHFFKSIPGDPRYHIELRTEAYLSSQIFSVLENHGVGQVLSHWTWLPSLSKQLKKAGGKVFNSGKQRIIRLLTPIGMRYEDAYAKAYPFDKLIDGMLQSEIVRETVDLMRMAIEGNIETSILINNRAGGNAPEIAQKVVEQFQSLKFHA